MLPRTEGPRGHLKTCFVRTALRIVPEFSNCVTSLVIIFILRCIVKSLVLNRKAISKRVNAYTACQRGKALSNLWKKSGQQSCLTLCLEQEPILTLHHRGHIFHEKYALPGAGVEEIRARSQFTLSLTGARG